MKKVSYCRLSHFFQVPMRFVILFVSVALLTSALCKCTVPFFQSNALMQAIISSNGMIILSGDTSHKALSPFLQRKTTTAPPERDASEPSPVTTPVTAKPISVVPKKAPPEIKINNHTSLTPDISALTASPPVFLGESPAVLIVHTHTTESYTPSPGYEYTPSDIDRTLDKKHNMVRVGEAVKNILSQKGITVYHDTTVNDYPSYNGSYNKSAANVKNHLKNNPSIKIVLDIHRDAIGNATSGKPKYTCTVDGKTAACIMIVAGSDQSGLKHDTWRENLSFALLLQGHISQIYPDLLRPLNFRKQRFNQQLAPGAIIVEIGTNGNTLEEALAGAELFAYGLADFLKQYR